MSRRPPILLQHTRVSDGDMLRSATAFRDKMSDRRSVRAFSEEPIDLDIVRTCIAAAASAPSGANKQPWTFALVASKPLQRRIRLAAEAEERAFYAGRAPPSWLAALEELGTDWQKPYLELAPALVVVFAHRHGADAGDKNYYVSESVGIAVGFLVAALHHAGLTTLVHTPSPMAFLAELLARPAHERAYALLPVGLPAAGALVPAITRKPLSNVLVEHVEP